MAAVMGVLLVMSSASLLASAQDDAVATQVPSSGGGTRQRNVLMRGDGRKRDLALTPHTMSPEP